MGAETRWKFAEVDPKATQRLVSELDLSPTLAHLLAARGLGEPVAARDFLSPHLSQLHSPSLMPGAEEAADRLARALERNERICVYGDYDVDGVTSVALLVGVLRELGAKAGFYIPNRLEEGYGLNGEALAGLKARGFGLVVTVDCGIRSFEEAQLAGRLGLDLIITDHHHPGEELPNARAVVHPGLGGYPFPQLAGVGVAFKLAQALAERMGLSRPAPGCRAGAPEGASSPERAPDLALPELLYRQLDLVALGSVADVVPLVGENRVLVREGLTRMNTAPRLGLRELAEVAGVSGGETQAHQIGFQLAPRLNAAGRLETAERCVELLLTEDTERAREISLDLDARNRERREIGERMREEALSMARAQVDLSREKVVLLSSDRWHEGVQGIVASRLLEELGRPTFLFTIRGDLAKGSGRSREGFHLHDVLSECSHLLEGFGGHAFAAGVRARPERLPELRQALLEHADRLLSDADLGRVLKVDCAIDLAQVNRALIDELEFLAPHGAGNPLPVFSVRGRADRARRVGNGRHLKFTLRENGSSIEGISFGHPEGESLPPEAEVAGHLRRDVWEGLERFQVKLLAARATQTEQAERIGKPEQTKQADGSVSAASKTPGTDSFRPMRLPLEWG